ncbi:conserved hypothetical protein [Xenorhabdus nematophila F1]|uniref:Uncharacterized protein n=1 Tax=Xenorhabdus nematophila (strain ATCC 19061 / DSM 3370 / CCUG 14189 / LMG 1036 / NCIMB 9965 / AN6) TaxID=406817 RepID=D3VE55_XENNA|nr:hypothetical protein [Xenorhabdus nematophila]CBJ92306.1 hypothetical protein XNC1_4284 [Xenorhabdus nematophila ATCC 19061]CCW31458.1 conserved hypothetical protein [Xenorhabdus nematophila F1]
MKSINLFAKDKRFSKFGWALINANDASVQIASVNILVSGLYPVDFES